MISKSHTNIHAALQIVMPKLSVASTARSDHKPVLWTYVAQSSGMRDPPHMDEDPLLIEIDFAAQLPISVTRDARQVLVAVAT